MEVAVLKDSWVQSEQGLRMKNETSPPGHSGLNKDRKKHWHGWNAAAGWRNIFMSVNLDRWMEDRSGGRKYQCKKDAGKRCDMWRVSENQTVLQTAKSP